MLREYHDTLRQRAEAARRQQQDALRPEEDRRQERLRAYEQSLGELTQLLDATNQEPVKSVLVALLQKAPGRKLTLGKCFVEYAGEVGKGSSYPYGVCLDDFVGTEISFFIRDGKGGVAKDFLEGLKSQSEREPALGLSPVQYRTDIEKAIEQAVRDLQAV